MLLRELFDKMTPGLLDTEVTAYVKDCLYHGYTVINVEINEQDGSVQLVLKDNGQPS